MGKEERFGFPNTLKLRPNKPVYVLGHQKDIFIEVSGEEQVHGERTNEERGRKSKGGRVECNIIGLPTSGCCSQQLYVFVSSSVSCGVLKVTAGPGTPSHCRLVRQVTEL